MEGTLHALLNDAIQKAYIFFQGFVNLLRLFEQRSTVYPRDMVLEQLPKNTLLVSIYLIIVTMIITTEIV